MIRTYDFPYQKPFRFGRKTDFHHVTFDDFGCLDDDDALYYADSLLNIVRHTCLSLDSFDFVKKFDLQIFFSSSVDNRSVASWLDD